jgi:hypothetical protein
MYSCRLGGVFPGGGEEIATPRDCATRTDAYWRNEEGARLLLKMVHSTYIWN